MPYIPRSQVSIKISNGELIFAHNRKVYKGPYMVTSKGIYYAGRNNANPGPILIPNPVSIHQTQQYPDNGKIFSHNYRNRRFFKRRNDLKQHLHDRLELPSTKSKPSSLDYRKGWFYRFFAKRFNDTTYHKYIEISALDYQSIKDQKSIYDYNLYKIGRIKWHIVGLNVQKNNSHSIKKVQTTFPHIMNLFPVLNEYLRPSTNIQENLHTSGGELYYSDGSEYIGDYHIHPVSGPMVGATHTTTYHDTLYYFNQLPRPMDTSYEDFLQNYQKVDCYRCISINNNTDTQIVSNKRSYLLGCLPNTYSSELEALNYCPVIDAPIIDLLDEPPVVENSDNNYSLFDSTRPNQPLEGGNNQIVYVDDVIDNSGYGSGFGNVRPDQVYTCFIPNTLVTMADGTEKEISSIQIGEKVKSEKGESTVMDIQIHEGDFEVYSLNNGEAFVTPEHPFKTIDGWKAIDPITTLEKHQISSTTLNLNDIIIKLNGKELISKIEKGPTNYSKVYNLMLDNEHVYYANGYLVHNEKINT
tara:strand:+ start:12075 stop:13652 length:1578 start_codon:yes stop_codon:yes gene_type:complete